jgi:hypothetical protein
VSQQWLFHEISYWVFFSNAISKEGVQTDCGTKTVSGRGTCLPYPLLEKRPAMHPLRR